MIGGVLFTRDRGVGFELRSEGVKMRFLMIGFREENMKGFERFRE